MGKIVSGKKFISNIDPINFRTKVIKEVNVLDSRGIDETKITTISIDDSRLIELISLDQQPFLRIHGNHRLSAAKEYSNRIGITQLIAPFCLILLEDRSPNASLPSKDSKRIPTKFEKTVFHNINSKSIPLTDEEIYRVIIDDEDNFLNTELLKRKDFGPDYFNTRNIWKKIIPANYPTIGKLLYNEKEDIANIRTVLVDLFALLREFGKITKKFNQYDLIKKTFIKVEQIYNDNPLLKLSGSIGLLVSFMFFAFKNNKFNIDWFTNWVLENHIYEIKKVAAKDLISIFDNIILAKHRTIFVSMQFNDAVCENHYNVIEDVIKRINKEKNANIKIYPLRIDRFKDGSAYKIPDAILQKIEESGLLIGDLTNSNPNVYHEVGYLMGLIKMRKQRKMNLILISNTSVTKLPDQIGFNIRNHKILGFEDTNKLREPLTQEILAYYFKN
ncbi:MAG: hypothetical protein M0P61_01950 [Ignavibacteriaceae bacterium]|nr:hypothetical protein [Ignavibacteriaceae bacterium]